MLMPKKLAVRTQRIGDHDVRLTMRPWHRVELVYWRPGGGLQNFGDHLSAIITTKMLADRGFFFSQSVARPARLLAAGSILHEARDGDVIWGSGRNGSVSDDAHGFTRLDVRAVRGPLTREFLAQKGVRAPEIYGDPALLLRRLLPRFANGPKVREEVIVPNLQDVTQTAGIRNLVSPFAPWNVVLEAITSSRLVLAGSLHAIIVAETYGIPVRYVRLSEAEPLLKYEDYFLGTGRPLPDYGRTIEEAREMGGMPPLAFDGDALLNAFPFDLWEGSGDQGRPQGW